MTDRDRYIKEIRRFQEIAGVELSSVEELGSDWDNMKKDMQEHVLRDIITHRIIQDLASEAGRSKILS